MNTIRTDWVDDKGNTLVSAPMDAPQNPGDSFWYRDDQYVVAVNEIVITGLVIRRILVKKL